MVSVAPALGAAPRTTVHPTDARRRLIEGSDKCDGQLKLPIMPSDGRMANTPTPAGLRLSGQVELARVDAEPDWARVEILVTHALRTYPGLGSRASLTIDRWMGHRPSTPDGRPVIGTASASADIVHALWHGHVGLAASQITGRVVADLIAGRDASIDLRPFAV